MAGHLELRALPAGVVVRGAFDVPELRAEGRAPLPMNQLVTYVDRPRRWEAWDIDRDYQEQATRVMGHADRIEFTVR
ncbi:MAG: hypothetical protein ACKOFI_02820, partial [Phycisphaerales bacterium]